MLADRLGDHCGRDRWGRNGDWGQGEGAVYKPRILQHWDESMASTEPAEAAAAASSSSPGPVGATLSVSRAANSRCQRHS
uniref:Uncharacterized protein n=1 Tax=Oryza barthii TaxID=65489 RepID=A0A0D3FBB2_9ORYZ